MTPSKKYPKEIIEPIYRRKMKISLHEFEQQVDEKILKRGFDYFKKGYIVDVDELGGGEYEATVEGSDMYTVNLTIKGDLVTECVCDCPYDMGPICKHTVAVLFYLQKDILETVTLPVKRSQNKPKEKSISQQADELLDTLSQDDLKSFVRNTCKNDNKFRQLFVAKHIHLTSVASKELYAKQIQALVNTYSDSYGFVDYSSSRRLGQAIDEIAEDAALNLEDGRLQMSMFAALAIVEEMVQVLNHNADDSNGDIGGSIEGAIAILEGLTKIDLDQTLHDELFDHLVGMFEKDTFKGWDWAFDTIGMSIEIIKTPQEKERIRKALELIKPDGSSWDWHYKKSQEFMLYLIEKTDNDDVATQYMESNLSNSQFRTNLIEAALEVKDYEKAEKLAFEGVAKDDKEFPGLADQWRNYLLVISQKTNDIKSTVLWARYFLAHSNGRPQPLKDYYDILKSLIPSDQWDDYLENIIVEIKCKDRWGDYDRVSQLYIWETQWDKLMDLLRQNVSFERIANAEKYLASLYSDILANLYRERILIYLNRNMGRTYYQTACQYMRRMIKLGARPMVENLTQELRSIYPARKALMEELNNI